MSCDKWEVWMVWYLDYRPIITQVFHRMRTTWIITLHYKMFGMSWRLDGKRRCKKESTKRRWMQRRTSRTNTTKCLTSRRNVMNPQEVPNGRFLWEQDGRQWFQ